MRKNRITYFSFAVVLLLVLSACGSLPALSLSRLNQTVQSQNAPASKQAVQQPVTDQLQAATAVPTATASASNAPAASAAQPAPATSGGSAGLLSAFESTFENVYTQVSPSVVNIRVVEGAASSSSSGQTSPFGLPFGGNQGQGQQAPSEALGSGFVWDTQGHIVTNNHVVSGATKIEVTFSDGTTVPAKTVGTDPDSDLAVIQVDQTATQLVPVQLADSKQVKVGEIAIAIGNPFGLQGTMTTGIVSAIGRSISASDGSSTSSSGYSIPDIIQTDAPINPGNSGGVLVNELGQVMGVTAAIESPVQANAGIGFAIPSNTVKNEIPVLIQSGHVDHPYLGISGTDLTPDLAKLMNLNTTTRGALVEEVVSGGPAEKAGLKASATQSTIDGLPVQVGGDVITAIDGQPVKRMDDLIAYLFGNTKVGQKVSLNVVRNGQQQSVEVTLEARPASGQTTSVPSVNGLGSGQGQQSSGQAYLGIQGLDLSAEINQAMNLPGNQQGVLVEQVQTGSPAEQAGLQASSKQVTINGQSVKVGGDVITAIDGTAISGSSDLQSFLAQSQPGQRARLTVIRNGQTGTVRVTLGDLSNSSTQQ